MAWRALLTFLLFNNSFVQSDNTEYANELHCCYSRYILNYFELHRIVFKNIIGVSITEESDESPDVPSDDIEYYDQHLRSQGHIVLAMLSELRNITPKSKPPHDLMKVNLYLNNMTGTTRMQLSDDTTAPNFIYGYRYFHGQMTDALKTFLEDGNCDIENKSMIGDIKKKLTLNKINQLYHSCINTENLTEVSLTLQKNLTSMEIIFNSTLDKDDYKDFLPENLLFKPLLKTNVNFSNISPCSWSSDDSLVKLYIVWNVLTNYKMNGDYASIGELLFNVRGAFDQDYVISFQQHVLAAVIHPVFVCLCTYLRALKKLHSDNFTNASFDYSDVLKIQGKRLIKVLKSLIKLDYFPRSVQDHLNRVEEKTAEVIKDLNRPCTPFVSGVVDFLSSFRVTDSFEVRIDSLFNMCSHPMILNNLQFSIDTKGMDSSVAEFLVNLKYNINDMARYVASLENYQDAFDRVHNVYDHQHMFSLRPLDIDKRHELGYIPIRRAKRSAKHLGLEK